MWKSFYEGSDLLGLPLIALGIFVVTFMLVVIRVATRRPEQARLDAHLAHLPLHDGAPIDHGAQNA